MTEKNVKPPPAGRRVEPLVVTLSCVEVLDRMRRGERLRWIDAAMIGRKVPVKGMRLLFLGKDELCEYTGLNLMGCLREGLIVELDHTNDSEIIDYEIA